MKVHRDLGSCCILTVFEDKPPEINGELVECRRCLKVMMYHDGVWVIG